MPELLDQFIEDSPIAIVKFNDAGQIIRGNRSFHALTQHTLENRLPIALLDLVPEEKRPDIEPMFKKALAGELPNAPHVVEIILPNDAHVSLSAYFNKSTHVTEGRTDLVAHIVDITEQKNLEMRFAHSQKMQAVGQLAGGVAHDFNNLLTAMIGFCDLLLMRHPAGDQSFADIMQIKQNANRAANLVRQLLAFSRRQTLQPKTINITDVLAELSNLIRRLIGENIELKMIHGRDIGFIRADQGQLEQVLINLAVNARDAMKGGGQLTIKTSKASIAKSSDLPRGLFAPAEEDKLIPPGDYILIEVDDNGTGIPKATLGKIFEPFFSTKPVGSGTGLGLSTVYGIIKQTGGYIYVDSRENEGTKFSMYFPGVTREEVAASNAEEDASEKAAGDLTGAGTIMLVEDETPVRMFAARALRNKGYTVHEADCGEAGIELMTEHGGAVDLIVTDVIMPGINGPTMVTHIKKNYPAMKVVFMSGYAEDAFGDSFGSERDFHFLAKPFTLKQLASKVKEVLQGK